MDINTHPKKPLVCRHLFTEKWTDDADDESGDERKTQDVGINTDLPVLEKTEQIEGRIVV